MKITLESESLIVSTRTILAGLYSSEFESAITFAEALLEHFATEVRRQQPLLAICPSDQGSGCDRDIDCESCPAFDLEEVRLIMRRRLSEKLNKEIEEEEKKLRDDLECVEFYYRQKQIEEYEKEKLLRKTDPILWD